jgi:hypothetical protein
VTQESVSGDLCDGVEYQTVTSAQSCALPCSYDGPYAFVAKYFCCIRSGAVQDLKVSAADSYIVEGNQQSPWLRKLRWNRLKCQGGSVSNQGLMRSAQCHGAEGRVVVCRTLELGVGHGDFCPDRRVAADCGAHAAGVFAVHHQGRHGVAAEEFGETGVELRGR